MGAPVAKYHIIDLIYMKKILRFPDQVNETSARLVAAGVALMALTTIAFGLWWLSAIIAYGFLARVAAGPTLSPLAQVVTRLITPRLSLKGKMVPGPPKRFAQAIGATLSLAAAICALGFGLTTAACILLGLLMSAAALEAAAGFCLGCALFAQLMRLGLVSEEICQRCQDIWSDQGVSSS